MTFRLTFANVHDNVSAVNSLGNVDYAVLNESGPKVNKHIATLTNRDFYPAVNPHLWDATEFSVVHIVTKQLMKGGHNGLDEVNVSARQKRKHRKKRLGPSRFATAALVTEKKTKKQAIIVGYHGPAKTQTGAKWRWPVMLLVLYNLRALLNWLGKRYPGVPIIVGGDTNIKITKTWKLPAGFRHIALPADMGKAHYTRMAVKGRVGVKSLGEIRNASDHDAPVVQVTL